jgi:hypothetical protein
MESKLTLRLTLNGVLARPIHVGFLPVWREVLLDRTVLAVAATRQPINLEHWRAEAVSGCGTRLAKKRNLPGGKRNRLGLKVAAVKILMG